MLLLGIAAVAVAVAAVGVAAAAAVGAPGKQFIQHPRDTLISQVAQVSQVVAATAT